MNNLKWPLTDNQKRGIMAYGCSLKDYTWKPFKLVSVIVNMRLKVAQKHRVRVQKKFKPRGANCKYSRPVTANSEAAMKKGA